MKNCKKIIILLLMILEHFAKAQTVNFQWEREINGGGTDDLASMVVDSVGNVYTIGGFYGMVDFDPGIGTLYMGNSGYTMFVYKLNPVGNLVWVKEIFGTGAAYPHSLRIDALGNVIVVGSFGGEVDFDPASTFFNITSVGSNDAFVLKLDTYGFFLWAKTMGGASSLAIANSVDLDIFGNIYTTGNYAGTTDFDTGVGISSLTSSGNYDIFIAKFDSIGNYIWAESMGGSAGSDYGYSLMVSDTGNIYLTGRFEDIADMNPRVGVFNITSMGQSDIFIEKLDGSGNMIWVKSMGGVGYDYARSIVIDSSENLYITGVYTDSVDFDPSVAVNIIYSPSASDNAFVCKYNLLGDLVWVANMGGIGVDNGECIKIDSIGNVYSVGFYEFDADFDPSASVYNLSGSGYIKTYISKLDNNGNFLWAHELNGTTSSSTVVGYSISVGITGDIYVSGDYSATIDFDPGFSTYYKTSVGSSDGFILKLSQSLITENSESQFSSNKKMFIYPNPVTNFMDVETDFKDHTISIYDNTGKLIFKDKEYQNKTRIDISNLSSGFYYIKLQGEGDVISKKFIKQ
jgi:Secretion system C-terminal sorting domain